MNKIVRLLVSALLIMSVLISVAGCSKSSSSDTPATTTSNTVALSGTVSGPGGSIAFNQPTGLRRFLAWLLSDEAMALPPGMSAVGSGITVNLIQIDNAGAQVGAVLATSTTDAAGNYILQAPAGFVPASTYVVQAVGTGITIQSFAIGTTIDVDPYTHATVQLITGSISSTSGASISAVTAEEIAAVLQMVVSFSADVSSSTSISTLVADLQNAVRNSADSSSVIASIASPLGITGTVTDFSGAPVPHIKVVVRTFKEQLLQSVTRTNSSGRYTVHTPAGDFIVAAVNDTNTSTAASAWWTNNGGTVGIWSAEKVTVGSAAVTKNFSLIQGGRISGIVTAATTSAPLLGVSINLRDFSDSIHLMSVSTNSQGSFDLNVSPGEYYIAARNQTLQPFATQVYNSSIAGGGSNKTQAEKITVTAGSTKTANMRLASGSKLAGIVTDPVSGPVKGTPLRVYDENDIFVEAVRTGNDGTYRIWLQSSPSSTYTPRVYGQGLILNIATDQTVTFNAAVSRISGILQDGSGNPATQVQVIAYDTTLSNWIHEISRGDGSFDLYVPQIDSKLQIKVDNNQPIGSIVYSGASYTARLSLATTLSTSVGSVDIGTVTLPAGAVLKGRVTNAADSSPRAGALINIRSGGTTNSFRYMTTRTMSDGSYSISVPANTTFARICAIVLGAPATTCPGGTGGGTSAANSYQYFDNQLISGLTTTLDFSF